MRRALLACLVLLVVAGAVPVATASPQPSPVCGFCGAPFERAADEYGHDVTVVESSVDVYIHENGTAEWVVRNHLTNGTDQFREDPDALTRLGTELNVRTRGLPEQSRFVSARVEGDAAVLVYRQPDAAERHAGLLVYDGLHDGGYDPWYHVNTDEFSVVGPEGSVVANDPDGDGQLTTSNKVTWTGRTGSSLYDAPDLDGSPYVVFGPDRSVVTGVRASAAVALATLPIVQESVRAFVVPQTLVFGAVLAGLVWGVRGRAREVDERTLAGVLVALGLFGGVLSVGVSRIGFLGPPLSTLPVAAGVLGGAALHPTTRPWLREARGQASVSGAAVAAAGLLGAVLAATGFLPRTSALDAAVRSTGLAVPFVCLFLLGGLLTQPSRRRRAAVVVTGATFALVPAAVTNLADPPGGLGGGLLAMFLVVVAVALPLVGVVPLVLGRNLTLGE